MNALIKQNEELHHIIHKVYTNCRLKISNIVIETEGTDYKACRFKLNELFILCRNAKITPKKAGLFVTFWKRNSNGITEPYSDTDLIDYFVINIRTKTCFGQFVFPRSVLIEKGVISSGKIEGKRGFRVYPPYVTTTSKQALNTQKWQSKYFLRIDKKTDLAHAKVLYGN